MVVRCVFSGKWRPYFDKNNIHCIRLLVDESCAFTIYPDHCTELVACSITCDGLAFFSGWSSRNYSLLIDANRNLHTVICAGSTDFIFMAWLSIIWLTAILFLPLQMSWEVKQRTTSLGSLSWNLLLMVVPSSITLTENLTELAGDYDWQ